MSQDTTTSVKTKTIIDAFQPTEDTLSSRGGLSLMARFVRHGGWLEQIASGFTGLRMIHKKTNNRFRAYPTHQVVKTTGPTEYY